MYLNEVFKDPRNPRGDFKILDNALEFLYIDSNDVGVNLRDLYNDALRTKKFRDLKVLINEWLGSRVSKETVVTIIIIAEDHKNENLKKKALKFIHK